MLQSSVCGCFSISFLFFLPPSTSSLWTKMTSFISRCRFCTPCTIFEGDIWISTPWMMTLFDVIFTPCNLKYAMDVSRHCTCMAYRIDLKRKHFVHIGLNKNREKPTLLSLHVVRHKWVFVKEKKHLCILLTWNFQGDELLSQFYAKRFLHYDACLIWLYAMHIISHFMPIWLYAMRIMRIWCLILLYAIEDDWYFLQWRECNDVGVGIALEPQCFSSGAPGELTLRTVYPALLSTHTSRHFRLQTRF